VFFCFHPDLDWDEGKLQVLFVVDITLFAAACFETSSFICTHQLGTTGFYALSVC
jgi:hypothetical protein